MERIMSAEERLLGLEQKRILEDFTKASRHELNPRNVARKQTGDTRMSEGVARSRTERSRAFASCWRMEVRRNSSASYLRRGKRTLEGENGKTSRKAQRFH